MRRTYFPLLLIILLTTSRLCYAQNNTNSPYTRFGYGEISGNAPGELRGMGGITTGIRNHKSINAANPASYTAVDSLTFMFDVGVSGFGSHFSAGGSKATTFNANLEYITIQFPLGRYFGFSAGLQPYSSVGYNYHKSDSIQMPTEPHQDKVFIHDSVTFAGTGGISQVYAGLSGEIAKHLSLGVNVYYMWGNINNTRTLTMQTSGYSNTNMSTTLKVSDIRLRYGLQAYHTFNKQHTVTLGLAYENKSKLNGKYEQLETVTADTIIASAKYAFDLPAYYSVGLTYDFANRLTAGIDYSLQEWSKANYFGVTDSLRNSSRLALGVSYRNNLYSKKYIDRMVWRLGGHVSNSYLKNDNAKNFGISFGLGLPLRTNASMVNAAFEYNRRGQQSNLQEDTFKFTLNASFAENWFFKRKL